MLDDSDGENLQDDSDQPQDDFSEDSGYGGSQDDEFLQYQGVLDDSTDSQGDDAQTRIAKLEADVSQILEVQAEQGLSLPFVFAARDLGGGLFQEQIVDNGTLVDMGVVGTISGGRGCNDTTVSYNTLITVATDSCFILAMEGGDSVGGGHTYFTKITGGGTATAAGVLPCLVKFNSGTGGNSTTACTFTYDIFALTDTSLTTPLATNLSPQHSPARINLVTVIVAMNGTYGTYFKDGATFVLSLVKETQFQENCPAPS